MQWGIKPNPTIIPIRNDYGVVSTYCVTQTSIKLRQSWLDLDQSNLLIQKKWQKKIREVPGSGILERIYYSSMYCTYSTTVHSSRLSFRRLFSLFLAKLNYTLKQLNSTLESPSRAEKNTLVGGHSRLQIVHSMPSILNVFTDFWYMIADTKSITP